MNIVVCIKQVPDTTEIKINPVTGTLIRDGVPSIMNPDDKGGLELALELKDKYGAHVTVITMGPPQADLILREAMAMGADRAILLTDRKFAGADTLATSHALAGALKCLPFDLIIAGRQAIDGDTAQVGPQVAEKLNIPQVTYAEEILDMEDDRIVIKRRLERGIEVVSSSLPLLVTVHATAAPCRPRQAKQVMKYKYARTQSENCADGVCYLLPIEEHEHLKIEEWGVQEIGGEESGYGLSGSPTKVKQIQNIVFQAKEAKKYTASEADIDSLMAELISSHTIG